MNTTAPITPNSDEEPLVVDNGKVEDISEAVNEENIDSEVESEDEQRNIAYDVILGADAASPQYGLLGDVSGRKIALDLNKIHTISLFGVQGGGKSYTLGSVIEMSSMPVENLNVIPSPLATVIFHYSPTIIMHKFNSPAWLKHIQKANAALGALTSDKMSHLSTGEAYVWSSKASVEAFTRGAVKVKCRPRVTQHGGNTKTAVS